jgi:uncharacterized protein
MSMFAFLTSILLVPTTAQVLVKSARDQLTWGTVYDARYVKIAYPNGDVERARGVCTDVIVRAYRSAGYDLQKLIHEHKRKNSGLYPKQPLDTNIDHRRMRNQMAYFKAKGLSVSLDKDWRPGDVVCWVLNSGRDHTGLVTDKRGPSGNLMVIHNLSTPQEEDCLTAWRVIGHYRFPK